MYVLAIDMRIGQRRWNTALEWILGLVIPLLAAGPFCEQSDPDEEPDL